MGGSHSWISHRVVKKAMKDFFDWPYRVRFWTVKSSKKKFPFVVDHHQTNKCPSNFLIFYINARFTQPNETQATCTIIPTMQLVPLGSHIYSQTIYTLEVEHLLHRMNCLACCCNVYCCVNINLKKKQAWIWRRRPLGVPSLSSLAWRTVQLAEKGDQRQLWRECRGKGCRPES